MVIRFPVPNNNLILKLYPNLKLFVKNILFSKLWLLNLLSHLKQEPEDKIGEPSPIRGNKFSHLSLEDFKETGDETFTNSKTG
jgi:hypothetical protein